MFVNPEHNQKVAKCSGLPVFRAASIPGCQYSGLPVFRAECSGLTFRFPAGNHMSESEH